LEQFNKSIAELGRAIEKKEQNLLINLKVSDTYGKQLEMISKELEQMQYHPTNVKLQIELESMDITDDSIIALSKCITKLSTSLMELSLTIPGDQDMTEYGLMEVVHSISLLTNLNKLSLRFKWCYNLSNYGLSELVVCISKITNLAHLDLIIYGPSKYSGITKYGVENFNYLMNLSKLTHLHLEFSRCRYLNNEAYIFIRTISKLPSLTELILNFTDDTRCEMWTNKEFVELSQSISKLKNLRQLSLNFSWYKEDGQAPYDNLFQMDEGFNEFSDTLSQLKNLTQLSLNFTNRVKLTTKGLLKFNSSLSSLNSLTDFTLVFDECDLPNKPLALLIESISKLKDLNKVELDLEGLGSHLIEKKLELLKGQRIWEKFTVNYRTI